MKFLTIFWIMVALLLVGVLIEYGAKKVFGERELCLIGESERYPNVPEHCKTYFRAYETGR